MEGLLLCHQWSSVKSVHLSVTLMRGIRMFLGTLVCLNGVRMVQNKWRINGHNAFG